MRRGGTHADPDGSGSARAACTPLMLRAVVGNLTCPACVCDADGSGASKVGDTLRVQCVAAGLDEPLNRPVRS
jgi:hypothetical protein